MDNSNEYAYVEPFRINKRADLTVLYIFLTIILKTWRSVVYTYSTFTDLGLNKTHSIKQQFTTLIFDQTMCTFRASVIEIIHIQ